MHIKIFRGVGEGSPLYWWDGHYLTADGGVEVLATVEGSYIYASYGATGTAVGTIHRNKVCAGHGVSGPTLATIEGCKAYDSIGQGSTILTASEPTIEGLAAAMAISAGYDELRHGRDDRLPAECYARNRVGDFDAFGNISRGNVFDSDAPEDMSDEEYRELLRRRAGIGGSSAESRDSGGSSAESPRDSGGNSAETPRESGDSGPLMGFGFAGTMPGSKHVDVWQPVRILMRAVAFTVGLMYAWMPGYWLPAAAVGAAGIGAFALFHRRRIPEMLRAEASRKMVTKAWPMGFWGNFGEELSACLILSLILAAATFVATSALVWVAAALSVVSVVVFIVFVVL